MATTPQALFGPAARMPAFFETTVGKKMVMALTGAVLFVFVVFHLLGNLLVFWGRDELNRYAEVLRALGGYIWIARLTLLTALILHIVCAVQLTIANWVARPVSYSFRNDVETNYAARTMIVSGPLLFAYVIYHLLMFTFLTTGPGHSRTDIYGNVVAAFQVPVISAVYIVAMLVLGLHLYHGVWSMLQTAGIGNPRYKYLRRVVAPAVAVVIAGGYIAIPVAVLCGMGR
jgi:succinate dehydrogenase / fumarate reductase cytochrome b subunit